jgi:peroxiredoxin
VAWRFSIFEFGFLPGPTPRGGRQWIEMKPAILFALLTGMIFASGGPVPRKAPPFQIQIDSKKGFDLGQFTGKTVVLAFMLTDCSHCEFTAGLLNKIQTDYGERVQVIGSAIDEQAANQFAAFQKKNAITFPVGYNSLGDAVKFMGYAPGVEIPLPIVMFIDRNGIIRAQFDSKDDKEMTNEPDQNKNLRAVLDRTIKQGDAAPRPPAAKEKKTP